MGSEECDRICELFPTMTLEDVKLKKVEETMMLEDCPPQLTWRNFIGVDYRSFYRVVEKKKKKKRMGVEKMQMGVEKKNCSGVKKKKKRSLEEWYWAVIRYPPKVERGRVYLGAYKTPEEAALVYDGAAFKSRSHNKDWMDCLKLQSQTVIMSIHRGSLLNINSICLVFMGGTV
ncbi:hypothetical protein QVD17_04696 [Tagetes erecta]|uniref:AP2/ERF domain-containing protein n=1 Tax=Tagetes erecta TaxID=13708 RepID=A0AAD8LAM1_TARER|nr:hypothetical protein QVD17_04696 [Tagetes erecta]